MRIASAAYGSRRLRGIRVQRSTLGPDMASRSGCSIAPKRRSPRPRRTETRIDPLCTVKQGTL
jgi:hypothetical protein